MRFRSRNQNLGEIPEINITPMLDVIMVVLAFFVMVSATLTIPPGDLPITLPPPSEGDEVAPTGDPPIALRVNLEADGVLTIDGKATDRATLIAKLPEFLQNNPESPVFLIPGAEVNYQAVLQLLVELQAIGGDRISLAVGTTATPEKSDKSDKSEKSQEPQESPSDS
jgi:biopolymer transport protein ExbD